MNFRQGANLDMDGQGAGLIKGTLRSRMEQVLMEDDEQQASSQSRHSKHLQSSEQSKRYGERQEYNQKKRYIKERDQQHYERRDVQARPSTQLMGREGVNNANFKQACDQELARLLSGHEPDLSRLNTLKVGNIRSLLNQETQKLNQTQADQFNQQFNEEINGSDVDEDKPQLEFIGQEAAIDYLAGMSKSFQADLKREVLMEQRNVLMKIRQQDPESRKYELVNQGFGDLDFESVSQKKVQKVDSNHQRQQERDYRNQQKKQHNCRECYFNTEKRSSFLFQTVLAETTHWLLMFPSSIKPLDERGNHIQLIPKQHFISSIEFDEDSFKEFKLIQRQLTDHFKNKLGKQSNCLFVEQSEEEVHCVIDVVAAVQDEEIDLESLLFQSLKESETEWERSNSKSVIDTRGYKGDLSRYFPRKGKFSLTHVDIDGKGGFAKLIEDPKRFGSYFILKVLAEGLLQIPMYNVRQSLGREQILQKKDFLANEFKKLTRQNDS